MVPPFRAPFRGGPRGGPRGRETVDADSGGGVNNTQGGRVNDPPFIFPPSLFGFSSYDRPTRTAPAVRGETGATPPFSPLARFGQGGRVNPGVNPGVNIPPPPVGGRSRL